jgi:hypothetical protein
VFDGDLQGDLFFGEMQALHAVRPVGFGYGVDLSGADIARLDMQRKVDFPASQVCIFAGTQI